MLLTSEEPVVRQFLNAQREGPIGMAEEKDADELAEERAAGHELPPLPPIPLQISPSDGSARSTAREPGASRSRAMVARGRIVTAARFARKRITRP
jgi:phospholipid/cholesterol/gamma-HCH transport system ATP-binding protein